MVRDEYRNRLTRKAYAVAMQDAAGRTTESSLMEYQCARVNGFVNPWYLITSTQDYGPSPDDDQLHEYT